MARYYVNKNAQSNGDHEVHKKGCSYFPTQENAKYLGDYASCRPAVAEARRQGYRADGCYYCSKSCHNG